MKSILLMWLFVSSAFAAPIFLLPGQTISVPASSTETTVVCGKDSGPIRYCQCEKFDAGTPLYPSNKGYALISYLILPDNTKIVTELGEWHEYGASTNLKFCQEQLIKTPQCF